MLRSYELRKTNQRATDRVRSGAPLSCDLRDPVRGAGCRPAPLPFGEPARIDACDYSPEPFEDAIEC